MSSTSGRTPRNPSRSVPNRRRKRTTLSRAVVLGEALALIDRDGLEQFSIRRLAERLGVTPMALYNHVNSKRDLLQAVAGQVVIEAQCRIRDGDWRRVVHACFRSIRKACLAHPAAIPLVESADQLPASVFRPMEITLRALQAAGLGQEDAVRAYFLLMTFTLGQMKYQLKGWSRAVDRSAALQNGRISAEQFPAVAQATTGEHWNFEKFFEFGVSIILAGLDSRIRRLETQSHEDPPGSS
jgi:TetR/AcrR family tetracycline transcriptional repressor